MNVIGKLFGSVGQTTPASTSASALIAETVRPGYAAWYSQQMVRSYATRSLSGSVADLIRAEARHGLPLAA